MLTAGSNYPYRPKPLLLGFRLYIYVEQQRSITQNLGFNTRRIYCGCRHDIRIIAVIPVSITIAVIHRIKHVIVIVIRHRCRSGRRCRRGRRSVGTVSESGCSQNRSPLTIVHLRNAVKPSIYHILTFLIFCQIR